MISCIEILGRRTNQSTALRGTNNRSNLDKLDEARFFLGHLQEEAAKAVRPKPQAFGHYLSAFITAARIVPWVLQKEEPEKYRAWISGWDATLPPRDKEFLKFMNERRLDEVHRTGIETGLEWEEVSIFKLPIDQADQFRAADGAIRFQSLALGAAAPPTVNYAVYHFKENKADVIKTCQRYMDYLEKLVREFVKAFPS